MNIVKTVLLVFASAVIILNAQTLTAAEVRSISREASVEGASIPTWSVEVACADVTQKRVIERAGKSGKWCSSELPTLCTNRKVKTAKKVCGTHFERLLAEYREETSGVTNTELAQELPMIEEKAHKPQTKSTETLSQVAKDAVVEIVEEPDPLAQEILEIEKQRVLIEEKKRRLNARKLELEKLEKGQ